MMRAVAPPLRATYRLQLDRDFDLTRARALVPYLARLSVIRDRSSIADSR